MGNETSQNKLPYDSKFALHGREFLESLLPNSDVWRMAPYKIAIDCAEDIEKIIGALTASIRKASRSSVFVGIGLILTGSAAWFLFCLEVYKVFFMTR